MPSLSQAVIFGVKERASGWDRYLKRHLLNAMIYFSPVQNACYLDNSGVFVASGVELAVAWQCWTSELCHQQCHECCRCLLFPASVPSPFLSRLVSKLLFSLTFPICKLLGFFFFPFSLLVHLFTCIYPSFLFAVLFCCSMPLVGYHGCFQACSIPTAVPATRLFRFSPGEISVLCGPSLQRARLHQ